MSHRLISAVLALAMIVAGAATRADAQGLTAQLSGVVTDTGGGVMPGVTVTIKNVGTNLTKETVTGADGAFLFPDLLAGTFDLTVSVQGFKSYEQKGIVIGATERIALRTIALEVGALDETVSVTSEATLVQTNNGARSALITRENLEDISLKGRDFAGMLKILPGVIDTSAREAPGWEQHEQPQHQRPRLLQLLLRRRHEQGHGLEQRQLLRAGARLDRGSPRADLELPGRVRPQLRRDDHGHHAQRHQGLPRQRGVLQARRRVERQRVLAPPAVRLGVRRRSATRRSIRSTTSRGRWAVPCSSRGPSFNKSRNKLFFFWSQDILSRTDPGSLNQRRTPTALERQGDFSQTVDGSNRLIFIRDPLLSGNCYSQHAAGRRASPTTRSRRTGSTRTRWRC